MGAQWKVRKSYQQQGDLVLGLLPGFNDPQKVSWIPHRDPPPAAGGPQRRGPSW